MNSSSVTNSSWLSFYPPVLTIFFSALLRVIVRIDDTPGKGSSESIRKNGRFHRMMVILIISSMLLIFLPPHSYLAAFWSPLRILVSELVCILPAIGTVAIPSFIRHGGPLGRGCSKLVEVLCGLLLLRLQQQHQLLQQTSSETTHSLKDNEDDDDAANENFLLLGPLPTIRVFCVVMVLSLLTIVVLWWWSRTMKTSGDHVGVNDMVQSSKGRRLLVQEHLTLAFLATLNAACEEVTSRGLWRMEFQRCSRIHGHRDHYHPTQSAMRLHSNLYQAIVFGIWHYHGIPNGLVGVALTFVYGLAMGYMADYQHGLLLPIVTHAIADYFIFATIARNNNVNTRGGKKEQ
jgi:membrane protease YdiL (CAAX protease family)